MMWSLHNASGAPRYAAPVASAAWQPATGTLYGTLKISSSWRIVKLVVLWRRSVISSWRMQQKSACRS